MITKIIAYLAGAAVLAAAVATAACASASATTPAANTGKDTTHLIVYSINSDGPHFRALATGALGDYGPGVTVLPNGKVDPARVSELELNLSHGSLRLSITGIHADLVRDHSHWTWNTANCSGSVKFTATVPVVPGSGTGAYRGITGRFAMTVTIDEVDIKPVCNGTSGFLSQIILMDGIGTVRY